MAQVQREPLHVLVLPGSQVPETAPRLAADGGPYTLRGSTQHFTVYYENSLGANGPTLADAVLASCENDYASLQNYFGGITPGGLPFSIYVVSGNFGAYHASCAATECHCAAFAGTDANLVRMLVVAEADEVFMAAQNAGWDCGASNGEGLSRVLATELYPAELNGFASAASWLDSNRPDWVTNNDPTDQDYVSIGCSTLFLNYLRYQLDISLTPIVHAGGSTLAQTFTNLTGMGNAFAPFAALLQRFFPVGTPSNVSTDNPFPLLFADHFYTTSSDERDGALHPGTLKLYRLYNPQTGDHFYTTSAAERDNAIVQDGYRTEGTACYVFSTQATGTTALYRLYNPQTGDHFYTTSAAERDNAVAQYGYQSEGTACYLFGFASYQSEGIACYVFDTQIAGTTPLYRLVSSQTIDHFYTTSAAERDNAIAQYGYQSEGTACYVFSTQATGTTALYRLYNPKSGDHFYTTSAAERDNAVAQYGYQSEGTACYVFSTQAANTTPLYRLLGVAPAR